MLPSWIFTWRLEDDSEWLGLDAATKSSLDELEKSGAAKTSLDQAEKYSAKLKDFLGENGMSDKIEKMPISVLDEYLRLFHSQLRGEK